MTMILTTKKNPINFNLIADFYFRRIKRIVPLFLFVIFLTLIAGIFLLAKAEYPNLAMDSIVSSTFTSNYLNIHDSGYFDLVSLSLKNRILFINFSMANLLSSNTRGNYFEKGVNSKLS